MHKHKNTTLTAASPEAASKRSLGTQSPGDWLQDLDRWLEDLPNEFEYHLWGPPAPYERSGGLVLRQLPVDLADNGREYILTAELPGANKEDLSVRVAPAGLEVGAERRQEKVQNEKECYHRERTYQSFHGSVSFPEEVIANQVKVKLKDGVLGVRLPKKELGPRRPPVKVRVE